MWFHKSLCVLGLALALTACSEAVPLASEGAFTAVFVQGASGTSPCNVKGHNAQVGNANTKEILALIKDTVQGHRMECAVTPVGARFSAVGILEDKAANHLDFNIPGIDASATATEPVSGNIGFRSATTANIYRSPSDAPCKFWFSKSQQIAAGRIWVDYACEQVDDTSHNSSCRIDLGTIAMQNCDQ